MRIVFFLVGLLLVAGVLFTIGSFALRAFSAQKRPEETSEPEDETRNRPS